jgi:transglutaminase-like putative cysteine protease
MSRPGRIGSRRASVGSEWPVTGALLLLLLVANGALGPVLQGTAWWWLMTFVVAAVLLGLTGLRRLGLAESLAPLAGLGIVLAAMTLLFGAGTGLLWLIPTIDTVDRFGVLVDSGLESIRRQGTPADAIPGILLLLGVGAGLTAVVVHLLAITLRVPALAGLPALVLVAVPGLIVEDGADPLALALTAGAYLVLLRVDMRVRRRREVENAPTGPGAPRVIGPARLGGTGPIWGSMVVGSVGVVGALVLSVATPAVPGGGFAGTGKVGSPFLEGGVTPLINLGQNLRRPGSSPALHYRTNASTPPYLKLLTLDNFVGATWMARVEPVDPRADLESIDLPQGLSTRVATAETTTQVVIDGLDTRWLPTPFAPTKVTGLAGEWYWDGATSTIASSNTITRGQKYTVTALELAPTPEQLRAAGTRYPAGTRRTLALPRNRPAIIEQTARTVTAGAISPYDAAVALQEYLRGNEFTYDTDAPVEQGYDGGGVDVIGKFLEVKRGYCVHFASAMAVMARTIGIPARIAIGYLPGSRSTSYIEGRDRFNVDAHDLHSWPELYFNGIGWVAFEPTPGRGTVPAYTRPTDARVPLGGEIGAPSSAPRGADQGGQNAQDGRQAAASPTVDSAGTRTASAVLAAILLMLMLPGAVRALRRQGRRRRSRAGPGRAAWAWDELIDTAVDHGVRVRDTETPRELAARLQLLPGLIPEGEDDAAGALGRLLVAAERQRFGPPGAATTDDGTADVAGDLDQVTRAIHAGEPGPVRIRAIVLPASLWRPSRAARNETVPADA